MEKLERSLAPERNFGLDQMSVRDLVEEFRWANVTGEKPRDSIFYIVIPAHNEELVIGLTIDNLSKQILPKNSKLVINVISNGSSDSTMDEVNKARKKQALRDDLSFEIDIRSSEIPQASKSSALNLGRKESPSDIVICLDADTFPTESSIAKIYALMRMDPNCIASSVMPKKINLGKDRLLSNMQNYYDSMTRENGAIIGKLMAIRNDKLPQFPPGLTSEDTWTEYVSIKQFGSDSVKFLGQHPSSDVEASYVASQSIAEYLSQLIRWESGFRYLISTYPELNDSARIADRVKRAKGLLDIAKEAYKNNKDIPFMDKILAIYLLRIIRGITKERRIYERFGSGSWNSVKSDRINLTR